ncbi:fatty acid CoA ligase family protein [Actinomadura rugatobispora]|uniref:Fatty acid CoA ligase family protein n=1 Tax=Actinomadura rugatobispora TaxID=1994 RepID=A0ABW0ZR74_9ACTN|nr:olefin beta-lactone synthetase OleC [Actinomadura rugatobispora]
MTSLTPSGGLGRSRDVPVSPLALRAVQWVRDQPEEVLCRLAGRAPRETTFAEMAVLADRTAAALARAGVRAGTRTAVMVPPGPELWAALLALARLRAVPVLVDPGLPFAAVRRCLDRARPEAFIGIPLAQAARLALGWGRSSARIVVTVGPGRLWWGRTIDGLRAAAADDACSWPVPVLDDLALIGFTSGSTGPPKGVPLRHRHLVAQLEGLDTLGALGPGVVMLSPFVPFALGATAFGATALIPDIDPRRPGRAKPAVLAADIRRHRVTAMFAPPALLDRLARHCSARGIVLDSLRHVLVAGAPLPIGTRERMRAALDDGARLVSVYGATECLPVAAIESRDLARTAEATAAGEGTCLGVPLPGAEVRVIGVTDEPIARWSPDLEVPPGTVGEITVAGPAVGDPYLDDPGATALARIADGDRVWHRMGDLGRVDGEGRLWFAGRKSERVRTGGGDLYTDQVEPIFDALPGIARTALVGVGAASAQRPVLVVQPEPGATRAQRIRLAIRIRAAAARYPHTAGIRDVLFRRRLPVDARHESKIRRGELAGWAARRLGTGRLIGGGR